MSLRAITMSGHWSIVPLPLTCQPAVATASSHSAAGRPSGHIDVTRVLVLSQNTSLLPLFVEVAGGLRLQLRADHGDGNGREAERARPRVDRDLALVARVEVGLAVAVRNRRRPRPVRSHRGRRPLLGGARRGAAPPHDDLPR